MPTPQPIPFTTTAGDAIEITISEGFDQVGVTHFGATTAADLWARTDGTAAEVDTAGNYRVPAGAQRRWKVAATRDLPGHSRTRATTVSIYCADAVEGEVEFS